VDIFDYDMKERVSGGISKRLPEAKQKSFEEKKGQSASLLLKFTIL
jgi:hypothetical protein